jgi:polysaccharide export outer membrane protein
MGSAKLRHREFLIALASALLAAAGCGSSGSYVWVQDRRPDPANTAARVVISPGDVLAIQVYGDENMSTTGRVLGDGTITVPVLGPVYAAGHRPEQLAASLEQQLKRYIQVPKVTVIIQESRVSVSVIGEVRQAGVVDLSPPATVLQALARAGGMTEFASTSGIFVLRNSGQRTERIRFTYASLVQAEPAAAGFHLKAGDVVVVE